MYCNGVNVLPLPLCGNMLALYDLVVRGYLVPEEWMDEDIEKPMAVRCLGVWMVRRGAERRV